MRREGIRLHGVVTLRRTIHFTACARANFTPAQQLARAALNEL